MPFTQEELQVALNKAKIHLMSKPESVFYTTVCFSMKHVFDSSIPTAATNGLEIRFNPEFFMKQSPEQRIGLMLHETCHVAFQHIGRTGSRDHRKFNYAADHVINLNLLAAGFKLPEPRLADPIYTGMGTEQVYDLIPEIPDDYESDVLEIASDPELTKTIEDIVIRAALQAKIQGNDPGNLPQAVQLFLNGLLAPKLPWYRILQKYIQALSKDDYSRRKPNRRYFPKYHLPSLFSNKVMDIVIAVDISGSVTDEEFKVFISEIHAITKTMKPDKITLIQFDTKIQEISEIKNVVDLSKTQFKGRGGTEIVPVLNWINEHKPRLTLVFTDGCFHFKQNKTKHSVVWLINNNTSFKSSFGKVIHYII